MRRFRDIVTQTFWPLPRRSSVSSLSTLTRHSPWSCCWSPPSRWSKFLNFSPDSRWCLEQFVWKRVSQSYSPYLRHTKVICPIKKTKIISFYSLFLIRALQSQLEYFFSSTFKKVLTVTTCTGSLSMDSLLLSKTLNCFQFIFLSKTKSMICSC